MLQRCGAPLRQRVGTDEPDQGGPGGVGDDGQAQRLIRTVHGRGYQFVGETERVTAERDQPPLEQVVDYCWNTNGERLAFASMGDGMPLVKAANWMTHLGFDLVSPVWRHWLHDLSAHHRLLRYDELGCGLSDWDTTDYFDFDAWVRRPGTRRRLNGAGPLPAARRLAGWLRSRSSTPCAIHSECIHLIARRVTAAAG